MRQQEREKTYTTRDGGAATWGAGERDERAEARGEAPERERQTTGAEECETEYDQLRQGSFDFEWGLFLCAPVRSGAMRCRRFGHGESRDNHSRTGWA